MAGVPYELVAQSTPKPRFRQVEMRAQRDIVLSGEGRRNVVRGSFVVFVGCGIILSTGFQPSKGGDMACLRIPLGAFCFICNIVFFNLGSAC